MPFAIFTKMFMSLPRHLPVWALLIALIIGAQSAVSWWFISAVETWIEPGLFSALDLPLGWTLGAGLVVLIFLCVRKARAGAMTLAFLAAGFVLGLQAFQSFA